VVGVVADAKQGSRERVEVDVRLLSGIVAEVEELKEVIAGLRNKYTGAKVSFIFMAQPNTCSLYSARLSSIPKVSLLLEKSTTRRLRSDTTSKQRSAGSERRYIRRRPD
jgi:hypothetical protein